MLPGPGILLKGNSWFKIDGTPCLQPWHALGGAAKRVIRPFKLTAGELGLAVMQDQFAGQGKPA